VSNGIAQFAFRRHNTRRSLTTAMIAMTLGLAIIAGSTVPNSLAVALAGAVLTGVGAGVVQMNTMGTVLQMVPAHARAGVTSAFLTACYVALSLPVVVAGQSAEGLGLGVVTGWYLAALCALVAAALFMARRHAGGATVPVGVECSHRGL
jgi:MFS family permease